MSKTTVCLLFAVQQLNSQRRKYGIYVFIAASDSESKQNTKIYNKKKRTKKRNIQA